MLLTNYLPKIISSSAARIERTDFGGSLRSLIACATLSSLLSVQATEPAKLLWQIVVASQMHAMDNNDTFCPADGNIQPIATNTNALEGWRSVGVGVSTNLFCIWTCPKRSSKPTPNPNNSKQWGLGYYGGITRWLNPVHSAVSASPIKSSTARPYMMLVADFVCKYGGKWESDPSDMNTGFSQMQAHPAKDGGPAGGNEAFVDGSARWIPAKQMRYIHSWTGDSSREIFFYQENLQALEPFRDNLYTIDNAP